MPTKEEAESVLQIVLRKLTDEELFILHHAVLTNDEGLIQGATVFPLTNWGPDTEPTGACLVSYPLWKGRGLKLSGDVRRAFIEFTQGFDEKPLVWYYDNQPRLKALAWLGPIIGAEVSRRSL